METYLRKRREEKKKKDSESKHYFQEQRHFRKLRITRPDLFMEPEAEVASQVNGPGHQPLADEVTEWAGFSFGKLN